MTDTPSTREPAFNIPGILLAVLALLMAVHVLRQLLPLDMDAWAIWTFGFVPARFDASPGGLSPFPGGSGALVWSFVTYALLHADFSHLLFNCLWLLPFGSAVARRFGAWRFLAFFAAAAIAGALAHLVTHPHEPIPMIGASAAISGATAAAIRFAFAAPGFISLRSADGGAAFAPAEPLTRALRRPPVIAFLVIWFGFNFVFGMGSLSIEGHAQAIAWQAHIGGFLVGLLLFSLFDPVRRAG